MNGDDAARHYKASGITRPPEPQTFQRGAIDNYAKAVLASHPAAYWPLNKSAEDLGPKKRSATFEKGASPSAFKGGRLRADLKNLPDNYSVTFWFQNTLPNLARPVTAYLFSRGLDGDKDAEGDSLGIGGTYSSAGKIILYQGNRSKGLLSGKTVIEPGSWHHLALTREGERVRVYLDGKLEIDDKLSRTFPENHPGFFFGGRMDNFANLNGQLDQAAVFDRVLQPEEITTHFKSVEITSISKNDPGPISPDKALKSIHVPDSYQVQLVAAEPLVKDPVAIDWGADGKLWVAEMADYPSGINGKPGGRVRFLEDLDNDGTYDKSTLFLDGLNFPAGIMSWKKGVLIAAAPDIIYAEDTTGDGKADKREILFTGFKQGNQQLRVNGLHWGLDNWVHGANGSHHSGYAKDTKITSPILGSHLCISAASIFECDPTKASWNHSPDLRNSDAPATTGAMPSASKTAIPSGTTFSNNATSRTIPTTLRQIPGVSSSPKTRASFPPHNHRKDSTVSTTPAATPAPVRP